MVPLVATSALDQPDNTAGRESTWRLQQSRAAATQVPPVVRRLRRRTGESGVPHRVAGLFDRGPRRLGAMLLWGISMFLGVLQNWIYSETAAMFPDKSGGIALYANEGWKRYFSLVGPVATFGYWFAGRRCCRSSASSSALWFRPSGSPSRRGPCGRVGSPDASPLHRHRRDPARLGANMRGIRRRCGWAMSPAPSSWCRCSSSSSFHISPAAGRQAICT